MNKNIYLCFWAILVLTVFATVQGKAQSVSGLLIGTWHFNYKESLDHMSAESQDHYRKMNANRRNRLAQTYQGRRYLFNADGSYVQQQADNRHIHGTWEVDPSGTVLKMQSQNGTVNTFQVSKVSTGTLRLIPQSDHSPAKILLNQWYFTKAVSKHE